MAAITTAFSTSVLDLIFNAQGITSIADNTATSPATVLYVSLHTGTLTASSTQSTSEAAYTSYARVSVARTSGGWTVGSENANPAAVITFPTATGGSETEVFFGVGLASSGTGTLLFFGAISPTIVVTNGVVPQLTTSTVINIA